MSTRSRAILLLWGIEGGTLLVIILASSGYLYQDGVGDIERRASEAVQILRNALTDSMLVRDDEVTRYVARTAFDELDVIDRITVTNTEGDVVSDIQRGHNLISGNHITVSSPVFITSNCFGVVDVVYSTESALLDAREHAVVLSSLAVFGMGCSGLTAWVLLSRMVMAIDSVSNGIVGLSIGYEPDPIKPYPVDNELGKLVANYNQLVSTLHGRKQWAT